MWDFDGDELAFFVLAGFAAFILVLRYFRDIRTISRLVCPLYKRLPLIFLPIVCLSVIFFVLWKWSDPQTVRGHADYMTLFMAGGALWVFGSLILMRLMGISLRDDAIERQNAAAAVVTAGAIVGHTCCYAGSNVGSGPTIWTTILPAAVASGTLMVLWVAIEITTRVSEVVTIDRHLPSGLVLGGFLIASGADLGWAMSGDWQSWQETMVDFAHRAWPAVFFAVAAIIAIQIWKPKCTPLSTRY
jgi:uncharacterized membrane protein YjfL (UPF0719 family)